MAVHAPVTAVFDLRSMLETMNSVVEVVATGIGHDHPPHPIPILIPAGRPILGRGNSNCRRLLAGAGTVGIGFMGLPVGATTGVAGLRLQFGEMEPADLVVSWHSPQPVSWPRVLLGSSAGDYHRAVTAATAKLTVPGTGRVVYAHYATVRDLHPATDYLCAAGHDGTEPEFVAFALPGPVRPER